MLKKTPLLCSQVLNLKIEQLFVLHVQRFQSTNQNKVDFVQSGLKWHNVYDISEYQLPRKLQI